jgi:hypothetical protein
MKAGTDYVSISTRNYQLKSLKGWGIRSGNKVGEVPEVWGSTSDGYNLEGKGYYLNTDKARIDLSPFGLKVDFNPSTILHPYKLIEDRSTLNSAIDQVRKQLDISGIDLDFEGAGLNRLDLTKQAPIVGGPAAYRDVWQSLDGRRMQRNRKQYPDGFEMGNTQRKAVFYHKEKQLREVKALTTGTPKDLTRAEVRWIKAKSAGNTRTGAGIGTLKDLREAEPEALTDSYNRFLLRDVFRTPDGWQTSLDFDTEVELLRQFRKAHPRGGVRQYILLEGVEAVIQRFGGLDLFAEALNRAGYERTTVYRTLRGLRDAVQKKGFLDNRRGETSTAQKVDFLRNLFCA